MRTSFIALVLLITVACCDVYADAAVSTTHEQAASELLELMGAKDQMMGGASAMIDAMATQSPGMEQYRDVMLEWSESVMKWEVFGPKMIKIYTDAFSEQELRDLIAFYETPTGRKATRMMPELMQKGMQVGITEAQLHMDRLQQMIMDRRAELEAAEATD